jgi:hypothetical protein
VGTKKLWVVVASVVGLGAAFAAAPGSARAGEAGVDDCLGILQTVQDGGLSMDLNNSCDRSLTCALSWTLKCEDAKGNVTASSRQSTRVTIARADSKTVLGSADACKTAAGWSIDSVTWSCGAVK